MPSTVLIIGDDPDILDVLLEGLFDEKYRAIGVADGRWATLAAVCAAARAVPIVIVTAHQRDECADFREGGASPRSSSNRSICTNCTR